MLYEYYTDCFTLYQSVISCVLSFENIIEYLKKCKGCTNYCDVLYIYVSVFLL